MSSSGHATSSALLRNVIAKAAVTQSLAPSEMVMFRIDYVVMVVYSRLIDSLTARSKSTKIFL